MELKIGNVVRVIKNSGGFDYNMGDIVLIISIDKSTVPYRCKRIEDGLEQWVGKDDIELVEYTWEDFKKAPIGTKVTFENGILVKVEEDEDQFTDNKVYRSYEDLKKFKDQFTYNNLGKIIKIEEPTYITRYEKDETHEMTIEEIENVLGYKIKIIK